MRIARSSLVVLALASLLPPVATAPAFAQALELPAPSPAAKVMHRVGLTDVTVDYSSPAVKNRKVWGDLVPWDKPWRTGANAATKITFSKDVTFGGQAVPAGTYALVTLPGQKGWTVILNKDLGMWAGGKPYDEKADVVRVKATTAAVPHRERLTFLISNVTDDGASLDIEWEKLRVSVPIAVATTDQAKANIQAALDNAWRPHINAARYLADTHKDYDTALKYADTSIAIKPTWFNHWIKAEILAKKGNYPEALKNAQTAWDMGDKDPNFFFRDMVQKALKDWKDKK